MAVAGVSLTYGVRDAGRSRALFEDLSGETVTAPKVVGFGSVFCNRDLLVVCEHDALRLLDRGVHFLVGATVEHLAVSAGANVHLAGVG